MNIEPREITVRELAEDFEDREENGVVGFGGKLDIRPPYQREFVYKDKQREAVIDTITKNYPLNVMYWAVNENEKFEVIDGQQRLTTLMLLLRAFYAKFNNMQDENSKSTRERIAQCLWKTNEFGQANLNVLKIDSEVATDNDKDEFLEILKTGVVQKEQKSNYAKNYRFFQEKIDNFLSEYPSYFAYLPARILGNCILLPVEAESQDTALRIFSTLNDRGLPLSDADIFKAQFYKHYGAKNQKESFIEQWKELEELCGKIFRPINGTPMDELFTRYMYFIRAKQGNKSSTTEALRKFYEKGKYSILKQDETLPNLKTLADFWNDVYNQNPERFSENALRKLFVLNYAPNGMWNYFLSVYFLQNKDSNNQLESKKLEEFLEKVIAFVWAYSFTNPGVNALRTPVYAEMIHIVTDKEVKFEDFKFDERTLKTAINNFEFKNGRPITKSMLTWWAFTNDEQVLPALNTVFEVEHIFAKKRQENDKSLTNTKNLESLGNKALLEDKVNIRASEYRFADKIKYYQGFTNAKGQYKQGTIIAELKNLPISNTDFTEKDIETRNMNITEKFITFLKETDLIKA